MRPILYFMLCFSLLLAVPGAKAATDDIFCCGDR